VGHMARTLPPDPAGSPRDGPELALLVGDAQRVADDRGGEAALRPDAEPLEVDDRRGLAPARLERAVGLGRRALRGHESEDDLLVVGDEREGVEAAGALV